MIYMKGVPEFPQCGFSSLAVRVLKQYGKFAYVQFYEKILLFLDQFNLAINMCVYVYIHVPHSYTPDTHAYTYVHH